MGSPEIWEYTFGWPSFKGKRSSYFYMLSCSHQSKKKKKGYFMFVENFLYSWVLLRFRNTIRWCFLNRTHSYKNLPYNIDLF